MPETGKLMMEMVAMARWSQIPLLVLGLWLIVSPFSLGFRSVPMIWNDIISGILVTVLAMIAFSTKRVWAAWANTFVGLWLAFAPIAFRTPDAAAYENAGPRCSTRMVVQPIDLDAACAYSGTRPL
jgi:hypothetical protein